MNRGLYKLPKSLLLHNLLYVKDLVNQHRIGFLNRRIVYLFYNGALCILLYVELPITL